MAMRIFRSIGGNKTLPAFFIGKFKVSVPENLSRKVFAIEASKPGGTNREVPCFSQTTLHFTKDLDRIKKEGDNLKELQWMTGEMVSHYFWSPTSMGIFYRKYENVPFDMIDAPLENIKQITAQELAIGVNNSVTENILKTGRATYIPDTKFEQLSQVVQLPDNTLDLIRSNQVFEGDSIDVKAQGWDLSSIKNNIYPPSRCLFIMPLRSDNSNMGILAVGYEYIFYWGNLLPIKELRLHYLLGDTLKLALGNLLFPPK
jgi:hypothetical protein